jgi:2',3'-cyclic-nucleotide 2'-phosphodiesterase (5'-nucleotidase family)
VRTRETNLANLITDSMLYVTEADIALMSGGNIRASIPAGDITMGHVLDTLPYSNLVVTVELSGADILAALEHGTGGYPEPVGEFVQVSGLNFAFDPEATPGSRVTAVTMADGKPLDIAGTYTVATIEFIAAGGDGYEMMASGRNLKYYGGDAEALAAYLKTAPEI